MWLRSHRQPMPRLSRLQPLLRRSRRSPKRPPLRRQSRRPPNRRSLPRQCRRPWRPPSRQRRSPLLPRSNRHSLPKRRHAVAAAEPPAAGVEVAAAPPPETTAPKLQKVQGAVIIRRGDSLWRISRRVYGHGVRYSTIYLANQEQIRDPDRIWPGQVFRMPEKTKRRRASRYDGDRRPGHHDHALNNPVANPAACGFIVHRISTMNDELAPGYLIAPR